jgi:hypothetical protein
MAGWSAIPLSLHKKSPRPERIDALPSLVMSRYDQTVFKEAAFFEDALP